MLAPSPLVTSFLAVFSVAYVALSVRVSRSGPQHANSMVCFFLVLVGGMLAGSAFTYAATDTNIYAIGRTLSFFSAGFVPVVFYIIYREYTVPMRWQMAPAWELGMLVIAVVVFTLLLTVIQLRRRLPEALARLGALT